MPVPLLYWLHLTCLERQTRSYPRRIQSHLQRTVRKKLYDSHSPVKQGIKRAVICWRSVSCGGPDGRNAIFHESSSLGHANLKACHQLNLGSIRRKLCLFLSCSERYATMSRDRKRCILRCRGPCSHSTRDRPAIGRKMSSA
jgi:hypothetical protein